MHKRRGSRVLALQVLYALDINGDVSDMDGQEFSQRVMEFLPLIARKIVEVESDHEENQPAQHNDLAYLVISGVHGNLKQIDNRIEEASDNWSVKRLSIIDRNILRIAVFEMVHVEDVPARVAINEAIEIAKSYSADNSPKFINGVLDRIYRIMRRQ